MEELVFTTTKEDLNNLVIFLDRVKYEGLKEVMALNKIMDSINSAKLIDKDIEREPQK